MQITTNHQAEIITVRWRVAGAELRLVVLSSGWAVWKWGGENLRTDRAALA